MRPLVWFRADLRVGDNTALHSACAVADRGVVAVFAVCTVQWKKHDWGAMKVDFVLRNLRALSGSLEKRNIPLLIIRADDFDAVPGRLLALAEKHACDALYLNLEYEIHEFRRDEKVKALFERTGRSVRWFDDQTILAPDRVRAADGGWYATFEPYRKRWLATLGSFDSARLLPAPKRLPRMVTPPDSVPGRIKGFDRPPCADLWPAGEEHAEKLLQLFIKRRLGAYHRVRDRPAVDGTSTLSPYLSCGVISPRRCLQAAVEANGGRLDGGRRGPTAWVRELIWREFYRHVLVGFPRVCMDRPFRMETNRLPWSHDAGRFRAWCEGRTGVPIVDAGMRQLTQTGWMHNRLRMITAMFLTKDLFIDWRWGEKHFMRHLVDADFANNNGGWQWSASVGTDAAPYFRVFNPYSQSRRFDPKGAFIRRFVPELAGVTGDEVHEPHRGSALQRDMGYPPPLVDHAAARKLALYAFKELRS